jgi:hypothetical protein
MLYIPNVQCCLFRGFAPTPHQRTLVLWNPEHWVYIERALWKELESIALEFLN